MVGLGVVHFYNESWNIVNSALTILFGLHLYYPNIIPFDVSPIRVMRIIAVFSLYTKHLHIMIVAMKEAAKFLMEALLIVFIFGLYFSL